jgi:hypothetical protein
MVFLPKVPSGPLGLKHLLVVSRHQLSKRTEQMVNMEFIAFRERAIHIRRLVLCVDMSPKGIKANFRMRDLRANCGNKKN